MRKETFKYTAFNTVFAWSTDFPCRILHGFWPMITAAAKHSPTFFSPLLILLDFTKFTLPFSKVCMHMCVMYVYTYVPIKHVCILCMGNGHISNNGYNKMIVSFNEKLFFPWNERILVYKKWLFCIRILKILGSLYVIEYMWHM